MSAQDIFILFLFNLLRIFAVGIAIIALSIIAYFGTIGLSEELGVGIPLAVCIGSTPFLLAGGLTWRFCWQYREELQDS